MNLKEDKRMEESISEKAKEEKLKEVADIYDGTTGKWEDIMGEHIHHGYYEPGSIASNSVNPSAQLRMIDEVLRFASILDDPENKPKNILDVGCGIGGTCLYLGRKYGAQCKGITVSPQEVERAKALAIAQGLQEKVSFEVADALDLRFPDAQFDLIWCMETAEHISLPEKEKLVREMVRVAAPGATIILTTWCHRDLYPYEQSLQPDEEKFVKQMCDLIHLSPFCSVSDYLNWFKSHRLEVIKIDDWAQYAKIDLTSTWKRFFSLLWNGGWTALKFIRASNMLIEAQKNGLVKLLVLSCRKPK